MALIAKAAFFIMCPKCKNHGTITCGDGTLVVCYSKYGGRESIVHLLTAGKIEDDEARILREQIAQSPLPERRRDADAPVAVVLVPQAPTPQPAPAPHPPQSVVGDDGEVHPLN